MKNTIDITTLKGFNINILNQSQIFFRPNPTVQPTKGGMARAQAIQLMQSSTNIQEWNNNRETVKNSVGIEAFLNCGYCQDIDGTGLINRIGMIKESKTPGIKVYKPFKSTMNVK